VYWKVEFHVPSALAVIVAQHFGRSEQSEQSEEKAELDQSDKSVSVDLINPQMYVLRESSNSFFN
jgi:hypothetical protein